MKKEGTQRSKKWIWIAAIVVAVLAIAGVVLGIVLSGTGDNNGPAGGRAQIYWNVDKALYTDASGMSTRQPEADGLYHITFAIDGEQKVFTFSDKRLVNAIDTSDAMGLVFGEDGSVVDMVPVVNIAKEVAVNAYVVKVEGNTLTLNASLTLDGMTKQVVLGDLTEVFALTDLGEFKGQKVELSQFKPMDQVTVFANDLDEVTHIALMKHPTESAIYWRTENVYNWTEGGTSRIPDENGDYSIEFLVNGEKVNLKCKDKDLVSAIDKVTLNIAAFGLIFDEEGYIVDTQIAQLGIRGKLACELYDVVEINGKTFTAQKIVGSGVDVGNTYTNTYTENTAIYNNSESCFDDRGQAVSDLQLGDRIIVYENTVGEVVQIIIWKRIAPGPLYYNFEQKGEKREPDANGWYQIQLFNGEETKFYKTKDREIAMATDSAKLIGLKVNGDIIEYVYPANIVVGNYFPDYSRYNYYVSNVTGVIVTLTTADGSTTLNKVMNANCKIYNMSGIKQEVGEPTTLAVGDKVIAFSNGSGELVYCYVQNRKVDAGVYYSYDRQYSFETGKSTRQPVNGWYTFKMAHEGKQVLLKTKSKALVEKIDKDHFPAFALEVSNGVILDVYPGAASTGGSRTGANWKFVGYTDEGKMEFVDESAIERFLTPHEEMKVYNVASVGFTSHIGEASTLQKGDQIVALTDNTDKVVYLFIKGRDAYLPLYLLVERKYDYDKKETTREPDKNGWYTIELAVDGKIKTYKTKDKDVMSNIDAQWGPFAIYERNGIILSVIAPFNVEGIDALGPQNYTVTKISGNKVTVEKDGDVKTMTLGANCKIYDASPTAKQFGMYTKLREKDVIIAYDDADGLTNYVVVKSRHFPRVKGDTGYCEHCGKTVKWTPWGGSSGLPNEDGHYYLVSDIAKGGSQTILNDDSKDCDVVLDLNGKTINYGGRAFLLVNGHTLSIVDSVGGGKVIAKGNDGGVGGIIYVASATLNIYGGTFEMPEDSLTPVGGGIYAVSATLNISNATVDCKGLQSGLGSIAQTSGTLTLENVNVSGAPVILKSSVNTTLSGKVNIELMEMSKGMQLDISKLDKSSRIGVDTRGVFTKDLDNPKDYLKVFSTEIEDGKIVVEGKALACYGKEVDYSGVYEASKKMDFSDPGNLPTTCPYCDRTVTWEVLPTATDKMVPLANGKHYYVPKGGTTNSAVLAMDGDVCIHLNGQTITTTKGRAMTVLRGCTLAIMGDGTIKGSGTTGEDTAATILNYGVLNMCGGTVAVTNTATLPAIVNRQIPNTTNIPDLNIYDGTVKSDGIAVKMLIGNAVIYDGAKVTGSIDALSGSNIAVNGGNIASLQVVDGAKVTLNGKPVIANLQIDEGVKVTVGKLTKGASIKVKAKGVFTENMANTESVKQFFSAVKKGATIKVEGKALACQAPAPNYTEIAEEAKKMDFSDPSKLPTTCPYCDKTVKWEVLPTATEKMVALADGKHYYVPKGGTTNSAVLAMDGDVCIHLNGQTINTTSGRAMTVLIGRTLAIMGNGTIKGSGTTGEDTAGAILNYGNLDILGGTITTTAKGTNPAIVNRLLPKHEQKPVLNLYAGEIKSSGIALNMLSGTATVNDGAKVGTIATTADAVLNVNGGNIANLQVVDGAKVTLSGKPVIANLQIDEGVKVTVGQLTNGASIKVKANGVFTNNIADANAAKKFFAAAKKGAAIKVEGKALSCHSPKLSSAEIIAAANAMTFPKDGSDVVQLCPYCDKEVQWTAITETTSRLLGSAQEKSKHYYLAKNLTRAEGLYVYNGAACLHLNGKTIKSSAEFLFTGDGNNAFTIMGKGTAKATADNGTTFSVNFGTFNIFGGTYSSAGGNVVFSPRNTDVFNLYAGTIGNSKNYAVYLNNGATFNMYGGTVSGKAIMSESMGGVDNTITIAGGTVSGEGIVTKNGIVNLQGGKISTVSCGASTAEINLSGNPEIAVLDLSKSQAKATVGQLTEGAEIGVRANGVFTNKLDDPEAVKPYFKGADEGATVIVEGKALALLAPDKNFSAVITAANAMNFPEDGSDVTAVCPHCEKEVVWTAIHADTDRLIGSANETSKHYYVPEDMTRTNNLFVWNGAACLHLNGKKLDFTSDTGITGKLGNEFTVMGNGEVSGSKTTVMVNSGTVNIYGGTYTSRGDYVFREAYRTDVINLYGGTIGNSAKYSVMVAHGAHFNMYGGTIDGQNFVMDTSGNIDSYITIKGGTILGDGIVSNIGQVEVYGGNISKIATSIRTSKIVLSGAPVIGELNMANTAAVAQADGLTTGAKIGIRTNGVFTDVLSDVNATKAFFEVLDPDMQIVSRYSALYCEAIAKPGDPVSDNTNNDKVAEDAAAMTFPADGSNTTAKCPYCDKTVTWVALTENTDRLLGKTGTVKHYYLADNVTRSDSLAARLGSVCLHLNGKRLRSSAESTLVGRVGTNLTIMGNGSVINDAMMTVRANYGTVNIFGGTYSSGGSYVFNAIRDTDVINFYAGTIDTSKFYAVYTGNGAKFNMYGGIVTGQEIISDNVSDVRNTVTFKGGVVSGDGVLHNGGTLDLQGGTINKIICGEFADTLNISGNPVVERLDLKQTPINATVGEMTSGASVGIRRNGVFTNDLTDPNAALPYFHCSEEGGSVVIEGSALSCIMPEPDYVALCAQMAAMQFPTNGAKTVQYCPHCEKDVAWSPMYSTTGRLIGALPTPAHYYLAEDIVRNENFFVWNGALCVNLNGHDITVNAENNSVFSGKDGHPITIMGNGNVTATHPTSTTFSVNSGQINIYGGTYTAAGSNVFSSPKATDVINIYGGTIGNSGTNSISMTGGGKFSMYGGEITGKRVFINSNATVKIRNGKINNGIVMNKGTLDLCGGNVSNISCGTGLTGIKISGAPVVGTLDMSKTTIKATVSELETGASIGINANGVFTTDFETAAAAESAKSFFHTVDAVAEIKVVDKALSCAGGMVTSDHEAVIQGAEEMKDSGKFKHYTETETAPDVTGVACPICGTSQTWKPLTAGGNINGGGNKHYYIARETLDIGSNGLYGNHGSFSVHVYLNDSNIVADGTYSGYIVKSYGKFAMFGDGTMTLTGTEGAMLKAHMDGTIDIYGGTYTTATAPYVAQVTSAGGNINLYGGTLNGGTMQTVCVEKGNFSIYGGTISGKDTSIIGTGSSKTDGYVNIYGGTVSGDIDVENGNLKIQAGTMGDVNIKSDANAVEIYGNPKIGQLTVAEGYKVNVRTLIEDANITVRANGVFTEDFKSVDAATAALAYFQKADEAATLKVEGLALSCTGGGALPEEDPEYVKIANAANALTFTGTGSKTATCPVCKESVSWSALGTNASGIINGGGTSIKHFYVPEGGITANAVKNGDGSRSSHIHLNGQTITANGTSNESYAFGAVGNFVLMGNGTVKQEGSGYALYSYGGTIDVYGGTYSSKGDQTIHGWSDSTVINLFLGTVDSVSAAKGTLNIYRAEVGKVTTAATTGAIKLADAAKVDLLDLTNATVKVDATGLKTGASVKVGGANGVFTTEFADADAATAALAFFQKADNNATLKVEGKALSYTSAPVEQEPEYVKIANAANALSFSGTGSKTAECPVCKASVSWSALGTNASGVINGGGATIKHFYVPEGGITANAVKNGNSSRSSHIHLNGQTVTANGTASDSYAFGALGNIVLMGNGTVKQEGQGRVLYSYDGNVDVYGGTYVAGANATCAINVFNNAGEINLYGGTFSGGTNTVLVNKATAKLNVYAATISGDIKVTSGDVKLDYKPVITTLDMSETTAKVTVGTLKEGASIGVKGNGVFTADFADADAATAAKEFFHAVEQGTEIKVEGKALSCVASGEPEPEAPEADENAAYLKVANAAAQLKGKFDSYTYDNDNGTIDVPSSEGIVCPICGTAKGWQAIVKAGSINGGGTKHFYIPADLDLGTSNIYQGGGTAHVFLNNKKVTTAGTGENSCVVRAGGNWAIFGEGEWTNTGSGFTLYANGGNMDVYGGTYTSAGEKTVHTWADATVINLYGGSYDSVSAAKGTVNIYRATVGNVKVASTFTAMALADKANITLLDLTEATIKIDATDMRKGASVKVKAEGVFTTDFANENAAAGINTLFTPAETTYQITVVNTALSCDPIPAE